MANSTLTAIEFFSGIGGLAYAARNSPVQVLAAYDQDEAANIVYKLNFAKQPYTRNLDSVPSDDIADASFWWLSPPCTPYTVRGKRRDLADPRSQSLCHLAGLIPRHKPKYIIIENVLGFAESDAHRLVVAACNEAGYLHSSFSLCPSFYGKPTRRPRLFVIAVLPRSASDRTRLRQAFMDFNRPTAVIEQGHLSTYITAAKITAETERHLAVDPRQLAKYKESLHIVDDSNPFTICFTSNYGQSYRASGSFIRSPSGSVRRFAPSEILSLLGFEDDFYWPASISLSKSWRLVGNSLDIHCVRHILRFIESCQESS